jgi:hypothetical protein
MIYAIEDIFFKRRMAAAPFSRIISEKQWRITFRLYTTF